MSRIDEIRTRLEAFRLNPYSEAEDDGHTKESWELETHAPADIQYLLERVEKLEKALKQYDEKVDAFGKSLEEFGVKIPFEIDYGTLLGLQEERERIKELLKD